ncbi:MAG: hypothetical protein WD673_10030 [Alphaproteobacteria bacterium]
MMSRIAILAVMMLAASGPGWAQTSSVTQSDPVIDAIFDEIEKRVIEEYFEGQRAKAGDDDDSSQGQGKKRRKAKGRKQGWVQGIPPGHLPPPGLCRAWLPDTPPGHQPPPGPCAEVKLGMPADARLVYGGSKGRGDALPAGLGEPMPPDLIDELPLPYPDTERLLVDDDIYLVRLGTRVILDVIEGVLKEE